MTTIVMRNGRDFLMKELKKRRNNKNPHNNSPHNNIHPRSDNNNINKKDSVIWTIQAVAIHPEVKTDLHKVGRNIIS
jgi:hypothetical protein